MRQEKFLTGTHDKDSRHNPHGYAAIETQPDIYQNEENAHDSHHQRASTYQIAKGKAGAYTDHMHQNLVLRRLNR